MPAPPSSVLPALTVPRLGDPGLGEAQQLQGGQLQGRPNAILDIQCWWSGLARRLKSGNLDSGGGTQKLAGSRSWGWEERIYQEGPVNLPLLCLALHLCGSLLPFSENLFLAFACPNRVFPFKICSSVLGTSERGQRPHSTSLTLSDSIVSLRPPDLVPRTPSTPHRVPASLQISRDGGVPHTSTPLLPPPPALPWFPLDLGSSGKAKNSYPTSPSQLGKK